MQCDDLVTEDIIARCSGSRDRDGPSVVGGDEFVRSPVSRENVVVDQSHLVDFVEFQGSLVD